MNLRRLLTTIRNWQSGNYDKRMMSEIAFYRNISNVHDLPEIYHYWSNKYLVPKLRNLGITGIKSFYINHIIAACQNSPGKTQSIASFGAGNCDMEIELAEQVLAEGFNNFEFHCIDINRHMLKRGRESASSKGIERNIRFIESDIRSFIVNQHFDICIANQSLHHFVDLEILFAKIHMAIYPNGVFLTSDMIGRNGHMRWPEALEVVNKIWREIPDRYKYNHILKRFEKEYENWDCSKDSFEGIRAQDILPLLLQNFHFELFLGFNNIVNPFIDRCFGHNFDIKNPEDTAFIDKLAKLDDELIEAGIIKPTQMLAALRTVEVKSPKYFKHLSPTFCVRQT